MHAALLVQPHLWQHYKASSSFKVTAMGSYHTVNLAVCLIYCFLAEA